MDDLKVSVLAVLSIILGIAITCVPPDKIPIAMGGLVAGSGIGVALSKRE